MPANAGGAEWEQSHREQEKQVVSGKPPGLAGHQVKIPVVGRPERAGHQELIHTCYFRTAIGLLRQASPVSPELQRTRFPSTSTENTN